MKVTFVLFVTVVGVALADELHARKIMQAVLGTTNHRAKRSFIDTELAFQETDTNRDGNVSLDELVGFVKSETGMAVNDDLRKGFDILFQLEDRNNDGFLDRNEYGDLVRRSTRMYFRNNL